MVRIAQSTLLSWPQAGESVSYMLPTTSVLSPHGPPEAGEHRVIGSRLGVVDPIELRMAHIRAPLELGDRHVDCLAGLDLDQLPARR